MDCKKILSNFAKQKRGTVVLESAIILIAFVIIAGIFGFMVINQGLFASNQGKSVIQQGLQQASTSLAVNGAIYVKSSSDGSNVTGIVIPLKVIGINDVSLSTSTTEVSLTQNGNITANIYSGVQALTATSTFDTMLTSTTANAGAMFIPNGDTAHVLNSGAEGYLVISLSNDDGALVASQVTVEVIPQQIAPLTIQFNVPASVPDSTWVSV